MKLPVHHLLDNSFSACSASGHTKLTLDQGFIVVSMRKCHLSCALWMQSTVSSPQLNTSTNLQP